MLKTEKAEFENAVKKLIASPIFAMSLGSKELFHSNFWAWLGENYQQFIKTFFPDIEMDPSPIIYREQGNRDITIWTNGETKAYVIENKLKSIPTIEQLVEYEEKLKEKFAGGVLTGISKPPFDLPTKWKFVSYEQICDAILSIANLSNNELHKAIFLEYAETLKSMYTVILIYSEKCANRFPDWGVTGMEDKLLKIKLWDVCQKFKVGEFVKYVNKSIEDNLADQQKTLEEKTKFVISQYSDYTRGSVLVDWRFVHKDKRYKDDNSYPELAVGIQIQNGQYRKFVQKVGAGISEKSLYEEFKVNNKWFKDRDNLEIAETNMRKEFCSYKGNASNPYHYVYQYVTIKEYSFEALAEMIRKDLLDAMALIETTAE